MLHWFSFLRNRIIRNIAHNRRKLLVWVSFRGDISAIRHCFPDWKLNDPRCAECDELSVLFLTIPFSYLAADRSARSAHLIILNAILMSAFSAKLSGPYDSRSARGLRFELLECWNLLSGCKIERCFLQSRLFLASIFSINVKPGIL